MFNVKLSTVRIMKRLRIWVLVSVRPPGSVTLFSAPFSILALGGPGTIFWTRGVWSHVVASVSRMTLRLMTPAAGTLFLSMFHNVRPVTRSISPAMNRESCALNAGLPIGLSAVIIWAGVAAPPALLPPLPLPLPGRLGNVVAHMLHPLEGTLQCTDVGSTVGWFFRGFNK